MISGGLTGPTQREGQHLAATDEELVRVAAEADGSLRSKQAASELLGRYRRRVYLWCYRYVRDPDRAMDLSQDVLLSAYRRLATFGERSRFNSWIYAIARNRCLNELRRPCLFDSGEPDLEAIAGTDPDPEEDLLRRMDEDHVLRLLHETLDREEQEVIVLRCFERMPIKMITEVLKIDSASGARGLLQRARRKLRVALNSAGNPSKAEP